MSKEKHHRDLPPEVVPDSTELPEHLRRVQTLATEPEAKPVPLVKTPKGVDAPPSCPVAAADPVPRTIDQNERAPHGFRRYKIQCSYPATPAFRYVLARSREEAVSYYLRATGVTAVIAQMDRVVEPELTVREQPD